MGRCLHCSKCTWSAECQGSEAAEGCSVQQAVEPSAEDVLQIAVTCSSALCLAPFIASSFWLVHPPEPPHNIRIQQQQLKLSKSVLASRTPLTRYNTTLHKYTNTTNLFLRSPHSNRMTPDVIALRHTTQCGCSTVWRSLNALAICIGEASRLTWIVERATFCSIHWWLRPTRSHSKTHLSYYFGLVFSVFCHFLAFLIIFSFSSVWILAGTFGICLHSCSFLGFSPYTGSRCHFLCFSAFGHFRLLFRQIFVLNFSSSYQRNDDVGWTNPPHIAYFNLLQITSSVLAMLMHRTHK